MEETKTTNFPITLIAIFLVALGIGYLFANPGVIANSGFFGGHAGSCGGNGGVVSAATPSQAAATGSGSGIAAGANASDGQTIYMTLDARGWSPNSFVLKKGVKTKWVINATSVSSCDNEIIVDGYGIDVKAHLGENVVEFTPGATGVITWHCPMNMYHGTFIVVNDPNNQTEVANATAAAASVPKKSGGCGCGMMGGSGGSCGR